MSLCSTLVVWCKNSSSLYFHAELVMFEKVNIFTTVKKNCLICIKGSNYQERQSPCLIATHVPSTLIAAAPRDRNAFQTGTREILSSLRERWSRAAPRVVQEDRICCFTWTDLGFSALLKGISTVNPHAWKSLIPLTLNWTKLLTRWIWLFYK